jgi:hypothetical protein
MKISEILKINYANCLYVQVGNEYEGLDWQDESPKPTKAKLESEWPVVEAKIASQAQAKIDAQASAIAKLKALGLTVDEVEAAFGLTK